ncbi:MAG: hypothetical protein V8S87_09770 [Oscillospiraceae bacterium]
MTGENYAGVTKTTIYIMYGDVTWYGSSGPECYSLDEELPPPEEMPNYSEGGGFAGVAKAKDDTNNYYIKIVGLSGEAELIPVDDFQAGAMIRTRLGCPVADIVGRDMYRKLADSVIIATDPEGNNIVMTINLKDDTAKVEEVISEDGTESKTPDGYNDPKKVNRDLQYAPENIVEADRTGESTADVTVRDTVIAPDPTLP